MDSPVKAPSPHFLILAIACAAKWKPGGDGPEVLQDACCATISQLGEVNHNKIH